IPGFAVVGACLHMRTTLRPGRVEAREGKTEENMMRQTMIVLVTILLAGVGSSSRAGEELYVYPAKGQSEKQQARDQQECHDWAGRRSSPSTTAPTRCACLAAATP